MSIAFRLLIAASNIAVLFNARPLRSPPMPRRRPLTLHDALKDWLEVRSAGRGLSDNTRRAYRADIEAVAARLAGPGAGTDERKAAERVTVAQLTPEAVVAALAAMQREGLAPATRARVHGTLAGLCAHLVHQGQLRVDPLVAAGVDRPKLPRSLPRYVERDTEIARVLAGRGHPGPGGTAPVARAGPGPRRSARRHGCPGERALRGADQRPRPRRGGPLHAGDRQGGHRA